MHVGIRSSLAAGKICVALLLGVAPITLVIPDSNTSFSQWGTGTGAQIPLFAAIDLHPLGFAASAGLGISGGQQVGVGSTKGDIGDLYDHALVWQGSAASVVDLISSRGIRATATCGGGQVGYGGGFSGYRHALLWRGSAASVVDLHPTGFADSEALGISGREQVGFGILPMGGSHALLWRGTAASAVDLHPREFAGSEAAATSGGKQVGFGWGPATRKSAHALLWRGSAASVVDLHPTGFAESLAHGTSSGQQVGWGTLIGGNVHALLWRGSAASIVDLNPRGYLVSEADGTNGEEQVGEGSGPATGGNIHALLWRGSAASVVDLHAFLPPGFTQSAASSIDAAGDIVGSASAEHQGPSHAILWKRNVPKPGTSRHNTTGC